MSNNSNSNNIVNNSNTWEVIREEIRSFHVGRCPSSVPSMRDFVFDEAIARMEVGQMLATPAETARLCPWRTSATSQPLSQQQQRQQQQQQPDRIIFLGLDPLNTPKLTTLYYTNICTKSLQSKQNNVCSWKSLLDSSWNLLSSESMTKEESLLRERMRIGTNGIPQYHYHQGWQLLVFPYNGRLFYLDLSQTFPPTKPVEILPNDPAPKFDPKIGGRERPFISFVKQSDLWVYDVEKKQEIRLTDEGSKPNKTCGVAEYIMQEEFHRFTGYYWSPTHENRILFVENDESEVELVTLPSNGNGIKVDQHRYPRAGSTNVRVDVKMVEFPIDESTGNVETLRIKSLFGDFALTERFPWFEYIPRLGWVPDGKNIWLQLLDRKQQKLALVVLPITDFECIDNRDMERSSTAAVLIEETSNIWINICNILYFFPESNNGVYKFIWSSECTGFRHLYLGEAEKCSPYAMSSRSQLPDKAVYAKNKISAITSGSWQVLDWPISVDLDKMRVYFLSNKTTPLESHLFVASLAPNRNPENVVQLTQNGYSHKTTFNWNATKFLTMYSSVETPPSMSVYTVDTLISELQFSIVAPTKEMRDLPTFHFFEFKNRTNHTIHGCYFTPPNYVKGKSYPTLLKVYAGPHAQMVTNEYKFPRFLQLFLAVKMGYAVVIIDGRGSANRGLEFESYLKHNFGQVELEDQMDGLEYLSEKYNLIDKSRIAITGWSYGNMNRPPRHPSLHIHRNVRMLIVIIKKILWRGGKK